MRQIKKGRAASGRVASAGTPPRKELTAPGAPPDANNSFWLRRPKLAARVRSPFNATVKTFLCFFHRIRRPAVRRPSPAAIRQSRPFCVSENSRPRSARSGAGQQAGRKLLRMQGEHGKSDPLARSAVGAFAKSALSANQRRRIGTLNEINLQSTELARFLQRRELTSTVKNKETKR